MARTDAHQWELEARFRRHAFGWKSQPAITRVERAVAEIEKAAKTEPVQASRLWGGRYGRGGFVLRNGTSGGTVVPPQTMESEP